MHSVLHDHSFKSSFLNWHNIFVSFGIFSTLSFNTYLLFLICLQIRLVLHQKIIQTCANLETVPKRESEKVPQVPLVLPEPALRGIATHREMAPQEDMDSHVIANIILFKEVLNITDPRAECRALQVQVQASPQRKNYQVAFEMLLPNCARRLEEDKTMKALSEAVNENVSKKLRWCEKCKRTTLELRI